MAGSAGKGSKKIVLFLAALICTVCMTGFTAKAASVEGNVRHSRSIAVQTRETIRVQKIRLKQAVLEKEQEIRRQKIRAKREARVEVSVGAPAESRSPFSARPLLASI